MAEGQTFQLPEGFRREAVSTSTGSDDNKVEWSVEIPQATSLEAWMDHFEAAGENPAEAILGILNQVQKQNGMQGNKSTVLSKVKEGAGDEEINAAIAAHQESASTYLLGAPRRSSGPTKKQEQEIGSRITRHTVQTGKAPTQAELQGIMDEVLGL